MDKILSIFQFITVVVFLGILLFVYAYLPGQVGISANEIDEPSEFIGKEMFFYLSIGVFLATNLIFLVSNRLIQLIPVSTNAFFNTSDFKHKIMQWFSGLGVIINLFFISIIAFLGFFNNADYYHISTFSIFAYAGQFLLFIWIVLFFYLVSKKNKDL